MNKVHFISGASLGILIGLLVGLSVSPVVASVVTALVALAVTWVTTIKKEKDVEIKEIKELQIIASYRLIGFSILCVVSILSGVFMRTHNVLGKTLEDRWNDWQKLEFSKEEARKNRSQ